MYKILLSIIILSSNTVLAMDGMHNHDSHNHNKHQDMTYVDGSKTKITDEMFLSFSAGLLKELNDNSGKNGYFSMKDMIANLVGITVAAIIIIDER